MTVVCVAAAVTSAGVAALGEAGAAAASGLAASAADKDNHREDEEDWSIGSQQEGSNTSSLSPSQKEQSSSTLSMAVENQLEAIQEANANQPIFNRSETSGSFVDNVRETAAYIAHDALNDAAGIGALVPSIQEEIQGVASHFSRNEAFLNEASPVQGYENLVVDAHEFIDQVFSTDQAELYSSGAKGVKDNFAVGMIPLPGSFEVTKFTEAGKVLDRAGFTKAGRALMKHGYREGSSFPKPTGNITQVNEHGQKVLESIINHPEKKIIYGNTTRHGHIIDIYAPDIGGVRYTSEGEFITFLEP